LQYYIGCSGWSYTSWEGPSILQVPRTCCSLVELLFSCIDYVEIDSSFYRTPSKQMVKNWAMKTPKNFKFTAKFPKVITHDKRLKEVDDELERFFDAMGPLENKTLALLIQLPPSIQIHKGLEHLRELVPLLDNRFRYAVEVRHPSWFQDLSYSFFANNDICLVWNQLVEIQTPPVVTTDFVYVRLIGDRSIQEKDFGRIQIDRIAEMQKWANNIKNLREDNRIKLAIVAANNHYAGFGPGTANIFRNMLGLSDAKWEDRGEEKRELGPSQEKQRTLSDFLS
jgi:uncharacterized protein YecE (DUF72 family)